MPTEQQTETREDIAKGLVMKVKELLYSTSLTKQDWQMIRAIEAALKDRDERAARIAEESGTVFYRERQKQHSPYDPKDLIFGQDVCDKIAAAIRNEG